VQSQYAYGSGPTKSVHFEHVDASGMSFRAARSDGSALSSDGSYDGAPAELDPLGGSMGTTTPYVVEEEPPPPPEPDPIFPFRTLPDDSPMSVDGRRITCIIDGIEAISGCGSYLSQAARGDAFDVDFENSDPFVLRSLGVSRYPIYRDVSPADPDIDPVDPGKPVPVTTSEQTGWGYMFSDISWAPQQQTTRRLNEGEVDRLRRIVEGLLRNERCAKFIEDLQDKAQSYLEAANKQPYDRGLNTHSVLDMFQKVADGAGFGFNQKSGYSTVDGFYGDSSRPPGLLLTSGMYYPESPNDPAYSQFPYSRSGYDYAKGRLLTRTTEG
jgi:hypothetical protein